MSEFKLISPLLDNMEIVTCVQSGGGTSVYLMRDVRDGREYMLKHISIPESQTQVDALLFTGAAENEEAAQQYFEQVVHDLEAELTELDQLRGSTNFATYLGYQVCSKETGVGFEVYLLSEKWPTLVTYLHDNAMTHLKALNLGLDLCTALCDLRAHGLIHRDIKPENIYLNGLGGFMLGDLGVARIDELKYCSMPERMVTEYTAPEMTDILHPFNTTIDIYSIGMVLYRILNGNHGPFEDEKTSPKAANKLRVSGEPLPAPLYSDYELTEIILKACAFQPEDRYQTPDELMQDLVLYMKRNNVTDSLIVPPIITDPDIEISPELMDEEIEPVRFADVNAMDDEFIASFSPDTLTHGSEADVIPDAEEPAAPPVPLSPPPEEPPQDGPAFAAPRASVLPEKDEDTAPPSPPPDPPSGKKQKKNKSSKKKIWIPIAAAVVLVAAIGVSIFYLVFGGPPLHIASITAVDRGTDYLVVSVDMKERSADLILHCTDTYGNEQSAAYKGGDITFKDLSSGSRYTVTVESAGNKRITGTTSANFTTVATTEIVTFTAVSTVAGQAELSLVISGPNPPEWTVRYSADGVEPKEHSFSGNTTTITGLEDGLVYTFELLPTDDIVLTGTTTLEFATGPEIVISDLEAASLSADSVRVTWNCGEDKPSEWTVTCTGTDGAIQTQNVTECEAEFTGLTAGETYTVTVTSAGTRQPATITVTPTAATVNAVSAEVQDDGSVLVSWITDVENAAWQVVYSVEGADGPVSKTVDATGTTATLTGLIPGRTYTVELRSGSGEKLGGNATAEVTTPSAGSFDSYGASRFFLGMFLHPGKDNWTAQDLSTMAEPVFKTTDRIVFALESLTGRSDSTDQVEVVYVVENASGKPVSTGSFAGTWDELWTDDLILGEVAETPQQAGTYTLRIYLNGQTTAAKEFTVQ